MPFNDTGRVRICDAVRLAANTPGTAWKYRPYTTGPVFDPEESDADLYGSAGAGAWTEGDLQDPNFGGVSGDWQNSLSAIQNTTWTASGAGTWPQIFEGIIVIDETNVLLGVFEFAGAVTVPVAGTVLDITGNYDEGEHA